MDFQSASINSSSKKYFETIKHPFHAFVCSCNVFLELTNSEPCYVCSVTIATRVENHDLILSPIESFLKMWTKKLQCKIV